MNMASVFSYQRHGFDDVALVSTYTSFKAICDAMEHPGELVTMRQHPYAPAVFHPASAAACLTLLDEETPIWTDIDWRSPAISWLQFGCGSSVVTEPGIAKFANVTKPAAMPSLENFRVGRYEYCEKATTGVVQVDDILPDVEDRYFYITGDKNVQLEFKGVSKNFRYQWQQLFSRYPLGIDVFFTCDDVLVALPKTRLVDKLYA
ncbi:MAG: phosphonate C-P lyase system protein PhnH [Desulfobacterales bacterium]|jgi:alpha-D-ribose 1-methylphosphonate 5-triphosphate synthase subunit PhnH